MLLSFLQSAGEVENGAASDCRVNRPTGAHDDHTGYEAVEFRHGRSARDDGMAAMERWRSCSAEWCKLRAAGCVAIQGRSRLNAAAPKLLESWA